MSKGLVGGDGFTEKNVTLYAIVSTTQNDGLARKLTVLGWRRRT